MLQAYRGIAAISVAYYHTGHTPKFGAFGVDIFFVLSGCVMAMLMESTPSPASFMWRRIVRIVPLYFMVTFVTALASWLVPSVRTTGNIPDVNEVIKSLLFIPCRTSTGTIVPVAGQGWSINCEMMFYLACACSLAIWPRRATFVAFGLVLSVLISCRIFWSETDAGTFYGMPIVVEFCAGLMVWQLYRAVRVDWSATLIWTTPFLIVAMCCLERAHPEWLISAVGGWYNVVMLLPPAAALLWIGLVCEPTFVQLHEGTQRLLVRIGDASYAIYLTHIIVLGLVGISFARLGIGGLTSSVTSAAAVVLATLVGILVHEKVDKPIQRKIAKKR